jgi:flagellin-like protein
LGKLTAVGDMPKAVSPLIAAVLLIAFTVAVGGIISLWLSSFTQTQSGMIEKSAEKTTKCAATSLQIREVRYGSGRVNVTVIHATGSEGLRNLSVSVLGAGISNSSDVRYTSADFTPGQVEAFSVIFAASPEWVTASAFCQSSYPIITECKPGQVCWKVA